MDVLLCFGCGYLRPSARAQYLRRLGEIQDSSRALGVERGMSLLSKDVFLGPLAVGNVEFGTFPIELGRTLDPLACS